jgi:hypothetical protein
LFAPEIDHARCVWAGQERLLRLTPYDSPAFLAVQQAGDQDRPDPRANVLAGLMLAGILALALIGLVTVMAVLGYGVHLLLA